MIKINDIEHLLNLDDPEIEGLHFNWDKSDCSMVGLAEILLYQCIKEHKQEQGQYYDTDVDKIKLRYGTGNDTKRTNK